MGSEGTSGSLLGPMGVVVLVAYLLTLIGIGLWGLHMGLTQGVLAALIAATAPERLRGTAFGLFGLISGLASLAANVLAGLLWDGIGAGSTFLAGAAFAATALIAFLVFTEMPGDAGRSGATRPI